MRRLNWIAGLYYFREETDDQTRLVTADGLFDALSALDPGDPFIGGLFFARYALDFTVDFDNHQDTTDYAAYFHGDYAFADRWTLGLGLRYTNEEKEFRQTATRVGEPDAAADPDRSIHRPDRSSPQLTSIRRATIARTSTSDGSYRCEADWDDLSGEVNLGLQWTDDVFAYGKYSRGFRSGGVNGRPVEL